MISVLMMLILMLITMMIMMSTTAGASTWNPICPWHRLSLKPTKLEAYGLWGEAYVPFPAFFPPPTDPCPVASGPVQCRPVPSNPASASCVHLSPAMFCMSRVCVMGSSPSHMDVSGCRFPRGFTGAWRAGGAWPESQTGAWPESTGAWPDKSISRIKIKESKKQNNIKK